MAGQSPGHRRERGDATAGRPPDVTTDTVLPCFSFVPGSGFWLRIWPAGAVIDVWWPATTTWNWSWRSLASPGPR